MHAVLPLFQLPDPAGRQRPVAELERLGLGQQVGWSPPPPDLVLDIARRARGTPAGAQFN